MHSLRLQRPLMVAIGTLCLLATLDSSAGDGTTTVPQPVRDWKELILVYLTDVKGEIEECGCKGHPRGGLAAAGNRPGRI
ncbi:MAG: hypothetical protein IPI48_18740 [bacterium]|nr:hypothetical protein [bacterium]